EAVRIGQLDLAETLAVNTRNSVVLCQPLVEKRIVGGEQFHGAAVVTQDVAEQHLGFATESFADVVVEVRERQQVGRDLRFQIAKLQPLARKVADERVGAFIGHHSLDLRLQHARLAEGAGRRKIQQSFVRNAAPQEEG